MHIAIYFLFLTNLQLISPIPLFQRPLGLARRTFLKKNDSCKKEPTILPLIASIDSPNLDVTVSSNQNIIEGVRTDDDPQLQRDMSFILQIYNQSTAYFTDEGWTLVLSSASFAVYTRPDLLKAGLAQYLVIATVSDASPAAILEAFLNSNHRKKWDASMKSIITSFNFTTPLLDQSALDSTHTWDACRRTPLNEIVYYRAGYPWPLKDRDYILNRSCRVFNDNGTIIVRSHSIKDTYKRFPSAAGAIRSEDYISTAAFLTLDSVSSMSGRKDVKTALDSQGAIYVSLSTDEQVSGSAAVVKLVNSVALRVIPEYLQKLFGVAKDIQKSIGGNV